MIIPPLNIKILLESNPLNSRIVVRRLAVSSRDASASKDMTQAAVPLGLWALGNHRWNRTPRPQPQKFSKLVFLLQFKLSLRFSKTGHLGLQLGSGLRSHWRGNTALSSAPTALVANLATHEERGQALCYALVAFCRPGWQQWQWFRPRRECMFWKNMHFVHGPSR